jgi:2-polyprenyl-6-methoxyphenol hydroxylase-like FAD-dependent oxidoreductase
MSRLKVLVVGAGLGGLCLAHRLRRADIDVQIFERDASPWERPQGYRLHLDAEGVNALRESLPPSHYALFEATSMRPVDSTTILDTSLHELRRVASDEHGSTQGQVAADGRPIHVNVDRAILRRILLTGLADICHFNMRLERYEDHADGVTAAFRDGSVVRGDVLVGADGILSTVRKQRLPEAQTVDAGLRAIYGRIPLRRAVDAVPAQARKDVFTIATDARKVFLGLGPVVFPTRPDQASRDLLPQADLPAQDDYVACLVGARTERFGDDVADLRVASSSALQRRAIEMLAQWPGAASEILALADPEAFFLVEMYTSVPLAMPRRGRVTLVGDAIHAMTPTLGRGANLAMRDGAMLGRSIAAVERGDETLDGALASYEAEMTSYGFDVVRKAAAMGERLVGQNPLPRESGRVVPARA